MIKKLTAVYLCIFFILIFLAPIVKNKTRIIEKNIIRLNQEISILEQQLNEAKIEYIYLSSPQKLKESVSFFEKKDYYSFDRSRIFLSTSEFLIYNSQETKSINLKK